jgi:hypothetical protein
MPPIAEFLRRLQARPPAQRFDGAKSSPSRALPWLALTLYLIGSVAWLGQPGPYYDEWLFVPVSLRTLGDCKIDAAVTHTLGCLPLTEAPPYVGAIKAWLMAPVFSVFGVDALSVRLPPILLGLVTLWLLHRFLRPPLGERAAGWTLLLLCLDVALVWHVRLDWGPFVIANLCKVLAFAGLLRWLDDGRTRDLAWLLAALCVGLFDKLNFLWVTAALGFAVLVVEPSRLLERLRRSSQLQWLLFGIAAAVQGFGVWTLVIPAMALQLPGVPDSVPLASRLQMLWDLYNGTFGGSWVHDWMFVDEMAPARWPAPVQAALLAVTPFAWWALRTDRSPAARLFRYSSAMLVGLVACLLATRQVSGSHHMIVAWPFPVLQAASLMVAIAQRSVALRSVVVILAALAIAGIGGLNVATQSIYLRALAARGPYRPAFEPVLEDVAAYLRDGAPETVVSVHWGLHQALLALSSPTARERYRDWWPIFVDPPDADLPRTKYLQREFLEGRGLALVEWDARAMPDTASHVDAYLAAWGACPGAVREFSSGQGAPLVRVRHFRVPAEGRCPP